MKVRYAASLAMLLPTTVALAQQQEAMPQLTCTVIDHEGVSAGSLIVQPDEIRGLVTLNSNIQFPAVISDSFITWKAGVTYQGEEIWFNYSISRYTGGLKVGNEEMPIVQTGVCTKSAKRLF